MSAISYLFPRVRIHCWGGLGSQVFALIFLHQVKDKLGKRRVELIFHSSGVTNRGLELPASKLLGVKHSFLSDFVARSEQGTSASIFSSIQRSLQRGAKNVLAKLGFLLNNDETLHMADIKPWTSSIRCSYNNLTLRDQDIALISEIFGVRNYLTAIQNSCLALHFRLGDLKNLDTKSYTDPNSLAAVLESIQDSLIRVNIFSDSPPNEVLEILAPSLHLYQTTVFNLQPIATVRECMKMRHFVGTSSKISLWIAVLRCALLKDSSSYLPLPLANVAKNLLRDLTCASSLYFYKTVPGYTSAIEVKKISVGAQ